MKSTEAINVAITGAAGQISYSLMPEILRGRVFGDKTVNFRLQELPEAMDRLQGVVMELEDIASPNLGSIELYDNPEGAFRDVNFAFLVGAMGRKQGEDRSVLLNKNGPIFKRQGEALNQAAEDVRVLVVGNPANTNALLALTHATEVPAERFTAMTRLDHNRAIAQLAMKLAVSTDDVRNMVVWGNHSDTMVPDLSNVTVNGTPLPANVMNDVAWRAEFQEKVAKRGGAVIAARGASSAMSAAKAAADHARDWMVGNDGRWYSAGVLSRGEYNIPEGIVYSFPLTTEKPGQFQIVEGLELPEEVMKRMADSADELLKEKAALNDLGLLS